MSARIKFEDLNGNALGYVDQKGDKLVPSNKVVKGLVDDYMRNRPEATAEDFIEHFGNPKRPTSFLYSKLIDTDDDDTDYPE